MSWSSSMTSTVRDLVWRRTDTVMLGSPLLWLWKNAVCREGNREGRAVAERALYYDVASVGEQNLVAYPKPQPKAAVVGGGDSALETLEDARLILGGNADAEVLHREASMIGRPHHPHVDGLSGAVLGRVHHEVRDHLLEPGFIPEAYDPRLRI